MATDPVLTFLAFQKRVEVDCYKTSTKDGFVCYIITSRNVLVRKEESAENGKRTRGSGSSSTTAMSFAVPILFRPSRRQEDINVIRRDYDDYLDSTAIQDPTSAIDFGHHIRSISIVRLGPDSVKASEESLSASRAQMRSFFVPNRREWLRELALVVRRANVRCLSEVRSSSA